MDPSPQQPEDLAPSPAPRPQPRTVRPSARYPATPVPPDPARKPAAGTCTRGFADWGSGCACNGPLQSAV
jgi:hypothetical protein